MGQKKMVNIIDKFQKIYLEMKSENGNFFLFMILKMDEFTDKWSVVVSAPWVTRDNQKEKFDYIASKIKQNLSNEEVSSIARLGIFQPDEQLVKLITETFRFQNGSEPIKLINNKVNGYLVHEAYIFESNPLSAQKKI